VHREIRDGLSDRIAAVRMLPGGSQAVLADGLAGEQGTVRVVDTAHGSVLRSWKAHDDSLFALDLADGGKLAVTAGGDRMVKFWEVASGRETMRIEAHGSQVLGLDLNDEGTQLVTGGADRQLKVWDVKTKESTVTLSGRAAAVNAVQWIGPTVLTAGDDGALGRLSDIKAHTGAQSSETGNEKQLGNAESPVFCTAALPDGRRIFAGTADGRILGWNGDGKETDSIDPASLGSP
jgi:WD40 repeat protein